MGLIWIILIDIVILILAIGTGTNIYQIIKLFKFDIPFTDEMIRKGVIQPNMKFQLLLSKSFGVIFTFVLLTTICLVGAYFGGISGYIMFGIGMMIGLFAIPPSKDRYTRSEYTIEGYINTHSICMELDKMK